MSKSLTGGGVWGGGLPLKKKEIKKQLHRELHYHAFM